MTLKGGGDKIQTVILTGERGCQRERGLIVTEKNGMQETRPDPPFAFPICILSLEVAYVFTFVTAFLPARLTMSTFVNGLHGLDFSAPCHSANWVYLFQFGTFTL
jgi:hypothetical protein